MHKYKVWMIQEGNPKKERVRIVCVGCGKILRDSDDVWTNNFVDFFGTKKCADSFDFELAEVQRGTFAMKALVALGFAQKGGS